MSVRPINMTLIHKFKPSLKLILELFLDLLIGHYSFLLRHHKLVARKRYYFQSLLFILLVKSIKQLTLLNWKRSICSNICNYSNFFICHQLTQRCLNFINFQNLNIKDRLFCFSCWPRYVQNNPNFFTLK